MKRLDLKTILALAALAAPLSAAAAPGSLPITWRDLAPAGGAATTAVDAPLSENLAGQEIRIEGYLLPVDREEDRVYQFMLVPWVGACSHMPQPPVNQMVLVTPSTPYRLAEAYEPVAVTGTLRTGVERTQFFLLDGVIQLDAGYSIGRAEVEHMDKVDRPVAPGSNPWKAIIK
ncbi:MAG: DUF3299 domain-containing protein [Rhizobiaceae bacterium]|nr:DUF3299 domain-containing protein [Rhizobiaceae bacterium]